MKKIIISTLIFCALLIVNAGQGYSEVHTYDYCWVIGSNSGTCVADADKYPIDKWDVATNNFYIDPTGDLNISFWAIVSGTGPNDVAYSTANWPSSGPTHYHAYGTGPYSSNSPYVSDYYGYLSPGYLNLSAYAYGAGSSAGLTANW